MIGGRYFYKTIRTGLSGGAFPAAEGGTLPTPGNFQYQPVQIKQAYSYGVIQLTGPLMNMSKGDKNAFAEALAITMDGMYEEFRLVNSILLYGYGGSVLGQVSSVSGQTITLVDDIHPITWFYVNQVLNAFTNDALGTQHNGDFTVTSIDVVNRKLTVSGTISALAANDVITWKGATTTSAPMGLLGNIDDGTYVGTLFNINRTSFPVWKSYIDTASGVSPLKYGNTARRSVSPNIIQVALDAQRVRAGHSRPVDQLLSGLEVRRVFWQSLSPDRRFNSAMYDGGWEELSFSNGDKNIPWFADEFMLRYTIFGLYTGTKPKPTGHKVDKVADEEVLALYESPWGSADWDAMTGSELKQIYSSGNFVDAAGAYIKWYYNFGTCRPNVHMRMDDIAHS